MAVQHIGIGLSGGVDSTVAAALLLEQGYRVTGFFMLLPLPDLDQQIRRAQQAARQLAIPLHLIDLRTQFQQQIIRYFTTAYRAGLTPNPCIVCNAVIKFGLLFSAMADQGIHIMASGHYASIRQDRGQFFLHCGADPDKDQSYFLCRVRPGLLARICFPLGGMKKQTVRALARSRGFAQSDHPESQDVCFLARTKLPAFLNRHGLSCQQGEIVTKEGRVLGRHHGIWHYTIGQRRGLGVPDATPWYVCSIDPQRNRLVVGKDVDLFRTQVHVGDILMRDSIPEQGWQGLVKIRSRHRAAPGSLIRTEMDRGIVTFLEPQRAITPGQFCVFYDGDRVVGSAVIEPDQPGRASGSSAFPALPHSVSAQR